MLNYRFLATLSINIFYDELTLKLVQQILHTHHQTRTEHQFKITLDRCKNKELDMHKLNIKVQQLFEKTLCKTPHIYHGNSKHKQGLQLADLFSYGVYQKFETEKADWYLTFESKIKTIMKL